MGITVGTGVRTFRFWFKFAPTYPYDIDLKGRRNSACPDGVQWTVHGVFGRELPTECVIDLRPLATTESADDGLKGSLAYTYSCT